MKNLYLDLFLTFARVGVCTMGGGYAMLPLLQREVVEKKGWATDEELTDYFAIGQCTPGVIAVNTATFLGTKYKGALGGVIATMGVIFPSVVIITIIAAFLRGFAENPYVIHAFAGVRACVCALILNGVRKVIGTALVDRKTVAIFLVVLVLSVYAAFCSPTGIVGTLVSPAILVILSGLVGLGLKGGERE